MGIINNKKDIQLKSNFSNTKLTSTKKLKLLFTIVKKNKVDYFIDLLQGYDANLQFVFVANGTTDSMLFTDEVGTKRVIMSVLTSDKVDQVMSILKEKFEEIKDGKGVAFAVPFSSMIGVSLFNFMSNNRSVFTENR